MSPARLRSFVDRSGVRNGLIHVFAPHATGVIILTEHEPSPGSDIKDFLEKIISRHAGYRHPSDAHSHLGSMLLCPDKMLPMINGRVVLGTWWSRVFVETGVHPRQRTVIMQALG